MLKASIWNNTKLCFGFTQHVSNTVLIGFVCIILMSLCALFTFLNVLRARLRFPCVFGCPQWCGLHVIRITTAAVSKYQSCRDFYNSSPDGYFRSYGC